MIPCQPQRVLFELQPMVILLSLRQMQLPLPLRLRTMTLNNKEQTGRK